MAAAIPAAIGVGSSLIGGISGKGAQKKQQKLADQLVNQQLATSRFGLNQAQSLYPLVQAMLGEIFANSREGFNKGLQDSESLMGDARTRSAGLFDRGNALLDSSTPYLQGAASALGDLKNFYSSFMNDGGSNAIDRFLPSARRTREMLSPEFGEINRGFDAAQQTAARFAPRGGGRIGAFNKGELDRQSQLSDTFFKGRESLRNAALQSAFQAASGEGNRIGSLTNLGLGQGQLGLGTIGAGNQTLGTGGGLAQNAFGQGLQALGIGTGAAGGLGNLATAGLSAGATRQQPGLTGSGGTGGNANQLGGFLVDLFSNKGVQDKIGGIFGNIFGGGKNKDLFLTNPTNPFANQTQDFNFFA